MIAGILGIVLPGHRRREGVMATTTDRSAQELLRAAARDIEAALTRLDTSGDEHDCSACGVRHKHYRNMTHARTFEQLTGTPDKLRRLAERIEQTAPIAAPSQKEK